MHAHAHESAGTVFVSDRDASSHAHGLDAPSIENVSQSGEAAGGSGQCPEGHASTQACCGAFCQVSGVLAGFERIDVRLDNGRLVVMIVAPAVKQRPTFIERPPKSIGPIFG